MAKKTDNITLGSTVPLSNIQRVIAKRMLASKHTIPCSYLQSDIDLTFIQDNRKKISKEINARLSTNDFIFTAMARAIEEYPLMAGRINGENIQIDSSINVGFAVAAPQGLVVPVLKDCQNKSIIEIASDTTELINKAKANKLSLDDMTGGCITLSSLAMFGVSSFIAITPQDNTSIIAMGKIAKQLVYTDAGIETRKIAPMSLSINNKIINDHYAAAFMQDLKFLMENPLELL